MADYKVKSITFPANAPSEHAGTTKWIAARLTATGRASVWCRHYHSTEEQARLCGQSLLGQ